MAWIGAAASAIWSSMPNCNFMASCFGSSSTDNRVTVEQGAFTVDSHRSEIAFCNCCNGSNRKEENREAWGALSEQFTQKFGDEVTQILVQKYFPQNTAHSLKENQLRQLEGQAKQVDQMMNEMRCARMFYKYVTAQAEKGTTGITPKDSQTGTPPRSSPATEPQSVAANVKKDESTMTEVGAGIGVSIHSQKSSSSSSSGTTASALSIESRLAQLRVVKRNNQEEGFDPEKLKKTLAKAPVTVRMTQEIIDRVVDAVITQLLLEGTEKITSEELETKVVEQLAKEGFQFREPELYHKMAPVMFKKLSAQRVSPQDYARFIEIFQAMHDAFSEHISTPPAAPADFRNITHHARPRDTATGIHIQRREAEHEQTGPFAWSLCCWGQKQITPLSSNAESSRA